MEVQERLADLHAMWRIRALEEKVRELRLADGGNGPIVGSVHLCIGQEAGPVGACSELGADDALFATYRGHGWALARGVPAEAMIAEFAGRATGVNGGRGGSAYFTAPEHGFHGENSIVGAGLPIAVGAALAGRFDGSGRIALTVFGDGALNQGASHEALNMAAAFRLPVVFVCENNYWSELTAIDEMVGEPELWKRAAGYGMAGERVDGNDPAAVRAAVRAAAERARTGGGPTLLELMTQRLVGHYIGDVEQYRRPGELDRAHEDEPIARLTRELAAAGVPAAEIEDARARAHTEMEHAAAAALAAPLADPDTAKDHVYA
ncbi:thiamine pyrophosphate-dependent dehydrogenase E1 component subunit alpha [Actinomadura craniellae]|uniref:Thiamine pyrophosphate-dependent dehydrogenase E1 component subunit alpha n=1 Tax=Actinomadura craniellae TaxID=2231787 RepID=A0A365GXH2_9ACTN|nr:thiamine pyrophosphate-dependent dehydrogenase E1 component subunit alpha [Actinomadura craniellae]RAY11537.1 thiamine pyrophosphate-dependent dehydrogenase E1 component subunit alpha [Actinomadura craniellae]